MSWWKTALRGTWKVVKIVGVYGIVEHFAGKRAAQIAGGVQAGIEAYEMRRKAERAEEYKQVVDESLAKLIEVDRRIETRIEQGTKLVDQAARAREDAGTTTRKK